MYTVQLHCTALCMAVVHTLKKYVDKVFSVGAKARIGICTALIVRVFGFFNCILIKLREGCRMAARRE